MRIEKLERRSVMDAAGLDGFCTSPLPSEPGTTESVQLPSEVYGPFRPAERIDSIASPLPEVGPVQPSSLGDTRLDFAGSVVEVPEMSLFGIVVGRSALPDSQGLQAALDILQADKGVALQWAREGIEAVFHAGHTYIFKLKAPIWEQAPLGDRMIWVDVSQGTIYTLVRF